MAPKVPGSRFGRLTKMGWLARRAVPLAWRRLRQASDTQDHAQRAALAEEVLEKHGDVAEEMFRTLGELKGLALKIGQMLSYMDGALPEEYQPIYQKVLGRLLREAPSLPWSAVEPVLVRELGRPLAEVFDHVEEQPFAAASIGQVHRARLRVGPRVAVKVQYPGVDKAILSDLKNAELFQSLATPFLGVLGKGAMSVNLKEVIAEIRARLVEELDYEREASTQERFARLLSDDPEIQVPRVFPELCTRRVLVSELMTGRSLDQVCASAPQSERDRYGAALTRVMFRSIYDFGLFNADPHPGNYLFPDDGRLVLLDFGCVKEIHEGMRAAMKRYLRAAVVATRTDRPQHWAEFDAAICDVFKLDPEHRILYPLYRELILYVLRPYLRDQPFAFTPEYTGESIDRVLRGMKKAIFEQGLLPRIPELPPIPADFTFLNRLQFGFYSVLTMLRANENWHRMLPADVRAPEEREHT